MVKRARTKLLSCAVVVGVLFGAATHSMAAGADDRSNEDGYRVNLLPDASLEYWQVSNCEVEVNEGVLKLVEGNGLVRSNTIYRDFVLDFEWQALKASGYDSGVYIRSGLPPEGRPWPSRYQINLKEGQAGNLIGIGGTEADELIRPGEWNHFRITVKGDSASLAVNGEHAWSAAGLETEQGFIGFQAEVPLGGQFLFRNITVTELDCAPLFNGEDLTGWEPSSREGGNCWEVLDGELVCNGKPGAWLRSASTYDDFNLRLEYLLQPGGNSGVYIRVPRDGNHHGADAGIEVQILDDAASRYAELKPYQFSASLYAIEPAVPRVSREAGTWNQLEIDCRGDAYVVRHNGKVVVETDAQASPAIKERLTDGYLGLQNHREPVRFRHLRIGPSLQRD